MSITSTLDLAAVLIFALSGGLAASRAQLDIVGFVFIACLTAVGGGTLRDLLLGRDPVFWVQQPEYILIATGAAIVVFFTAHLLESRYNTLRWLDACALAVAVSAGTGVALSVSAPAVIVVTMGVATACFGGLMRDVVCNEVPLILKPGELYATAAFAGSLTALLVLWLAVPTFIALLAGAAVTFLLRAGSMVFGWQLPAYKSRPPR
ncbi:hypothetical protein ATO10_07362 [Actibacterium atlanticum]|uniref:Glycine transporter domain-containing protein n=1 Tax=Actibacterium atlanticum TaxID=1461693 RepID=A0A058ZKP2_9RHOB|nr:trimeric intracellular cation channel family protein [Actibacterium atlanticum]KCV82189.1 hypothetical protein ATO10_07362 [Actibacterium atlanticum]